MSKKTNKIDLLNGVRVKIETRSKLSIFFQNFKYAILFSIIGCITFMKIGPSYAMQYYFSIDSALMWNAICNTVLTIWGLVVAVYLHKEIIEMKYKDDFVQRWGDFWGNFIRPTVSIVLLISAGMLLMTFYVLKLTDLRIDELIRISTQ